MSQQGGEAASSEKGADHKGRPSVHTDRKSDLLSLNLFMGRVFSTKRSCHRLIIPYFDQCEKLRKVVHPHFTGVKGIVH